MLNPSDKIGEVNFMNKSGLFVLHEGVGSTIFASQVMEHALCMEKNGIDISILTFETFQNSKIESEENLKKIQDKYPSFKVNLKVGANIYLPFSSLINAYLLLRYLFEHKNKFSFIHARADYTAFLSLITKPIHGLPVIWDCRGDAVGELQDSLTRKPGWLRVTLGQVLLVRQRAMAAFNRLYSDGAIFVSQELLKLHSKNLRTRKLIVVPCPVPAEKFFFNESIRLRMRSSYGLTDNQRVYLYSGSVVAYQGLDDQYELYNQLLKKSDNVIFFATSNPTFAQEFFKNLVSKRFNIVSVNYDKMNEIYNLADFAFMLREPKTLNWVASPTKFGEYCLTGLPVILNDTIQQASENAKKIGNNIDENEIYNASRFTNEFRHLIASRSLSIYSRESSSDIYRNLYLTV